MNDSIEAMKKVLAVAAFVVLGCSYACVGEDPSLSTAPTDERTADPDAALLESGLPPSDAARGSDAADADADAADAGPTCDPDLVGLWHANNTAQDAIRQDGLPNDLTWSDPLHVTYTAGKDGQAFDFSSTANVPVKPAVFRDPATRLTTATSLTVSLWARSFLAAGAAEGNLVDISPAPASPSTRISVSVERPAPPGAATSNQVGVSVNGEFKNFAASLRDQAADQWRHYVVTLRPSGGNTAIAVYVDGAAAGTDSAAGVLVSLASARLSFGGSYANFYDFRGALDEIALYRRALSQAEITALHASVVPSFCPP